jgi:hypothetical protein
VGLIDATAGANENVYCWEKISRVGSLAGTTYLANQSPPVIIVVRVVSGYLAGRLMRGGGFGLIGDLVVGLIGAFYRRLAVAATWYSSRHKPG